jgi:hypothetical protein
MTMKPDVHRGSDIPNTMVRNGVYYYRRRVPKALSRAIWRKMIQYSLETKIADLAYERARVADLRWEKIFLLAEDEMR